MIRYYSLFLAIFACAPLFAQAPPAQLLLPSRTLEPNSTFELRFATEMVGAEDVGKPGTVSPLLLEPKLS